MASLLLALPLLAVGSAPAHAVDPPLTAAFEDVPGTHDGAAFTFGLSFSAPVATSYKVLRDSAFDVSNGSVTGARRVDGRSDLWQITVQPAEVTEDTVDDDIVVVLPVTEACGDTGAVCTSGDAKALSNRSEATIVGPLAPPAPPPTSEVQQQERKGVSEQRVGTRQADTSPPEVTVEAGDEVIQGVTIVPSYRAFDQDPPGETDWHAVNVQRGDPCDASAFTPGDADYNERDNRPYVALGTYRMCFRSVDTSGNAGYGESREFGGGGPFPPDDPPLVSSPVIETSVGRSEATIGDFDFENHRESDFTCYTPTGIWLNDDADKAYVANSCGMRLDAFDVTDDGTLSYDADDSYSRHQLFPNLGWVTLTPSGTRHVPIYSPSGVWSNGTTMWLADRDRGRIFAYSVADKSRQRDKEIVLLPDDARANRLAPTGIWSDGDTMWVADAVNKLVFAVTLEGSLTRRASRRFIASPLDACHDPDNPPTTGFAFDPFLNGACTSGLSLANALGERDSMGGIWSNGTLLWVAVHDGDSNGPGTGKLWAFNLISGDRVPSRDVILDSANRWPDGISVSGTTLRVTDSTSERLFTYTWNPNPAT